jgi:hypothetical protein
VGSANRKREAEGASPTEREGVAPIESSATGSVVVWWRRRWADVAVPTGRERWVVPAGRQAERGGWHR